MLRQRTPFESEATLSNLPAPGCVRSIRRARLFNPKNTIEKNSLDFLCDTSRRCRASAAAAAKRLDCDRAAAAALQLELRQPETQPVPKAYQK